MSHLNTPTDREGAWKGFGPLPERAWARAVRTAPPLPRGVQRSTSTAHLQGDRAHPYIARLLRDARVLPLRVSARTIVAEPLVLDWKALGRSIVSLSVGKGATLVIDERISGPMLGAVEVRLGEGAMLTWNTTTHLEAGEIAVHHRSLSLAASSNATCSLDLSGSGRLFLADTQTLLGADADASMHARIRLNGDARFAHDVRQEIAAPRGKTRLSARIVVGGRARSTFRSALHMTREAQGADGAQTHRALLLSDQAVNDATPALEILADDVRCTHAAATSRLDDEMLFYLLARGLPRTEAEAMLVDAFLRQA